MYHYDLWYRNGYNYDYYYDYLVGGDTANQNLTTVSPTYDVSDYSGMSVFNWLLWILAFCGKNELYGVCVCVCVCVLIQCTHNICTYVHNCVLRIRMYNMKIV